MPGTEFWRAPEVKAIADELIPKHHIHLNRYDVAIKYVFRDPAARSKGRLVYGRAKKVSGLPALGTRGHDLEEFTEVVKRHGLWRPPVVEFAETAKAAQLAFPINAGSAGDVLRTGAGLRIGQQGGGGDAE